MINSRHLVAVRAVVNVMSDRHLMPMDREGVIEEALKYERDHCLTREDVEIALTLPLEELLDVRGGE